MASRSLTVLATNVRHPMLERFGRRSSVQLGAKSGLGQHTVNNVEKARHDPRLSTIDAIAKALGLPAYQLLIPAGVERGFISLCDAWNQTDELGRELLLGAAETVLRRRPTPRHPS